QRSGGRGSARPHARSPGPRRRSPPAVAGTNRRGRELSWRVVLVATSGPLVGPDPARPTSGPLVATVVGGGALLSYHGIRTQAAAQRSQEENHDDSQGGHRRRRVRHTLPAGHQGAAQGTEPHRR